MFWLPTPRNLANDSLPLTEKTTPDAVQKEKNEIVAGRRAGVTSQAKEVKNFCNGYWQIASGVNEHRRCMDQAFAHVVRRFGTGSTSAHLEIPIQRNCCHTCVSVETDSLAG
jgi:hypothetical protein